MTHPLNLGLLLFLFLGISCSKEKQADSEAFAVLNYDTIDFVHSMKGWEMYSWPNGNDWNFSLIPGTNRLKSYSEVIENPYRVTGLEALENLLSCLPANEEIIIIEEQWLAQIWVEHYYDLQSPSLSVILEIKQMADEMGLQIWASNE